MIVIERAPCESKPRTTFSGEELANTISHCIGLIAAIIATPVLLFAAWRSGNVLFFAGTIVFAATMFVLYLASMLYHAWPPTRAKQTLRLLDHCAIFLLIAGTYTPFSLGPLHGVWGSTILGYIWLLAIFGIILKVTCGPSRHRGFTLFLYLAMSWSALILIRPLFSHLPTGALFWLLTGGIAYTSGVLFFVNERMRYAHFIWHLFVLTGTSCHFLALLACAA
jgi:hemolysin III